MILWPFNTSIYTLTTADFVPLDLCDALFATNILACDSDNSGRQYEIMDEASRLVSELQGKLAELDHRVWQYQRDMAAEFTKYTEDVLRNVPKDVSETVAKAIANDIKNHRSLHLGALDTIESCRAGNSDGSGSATWLSLGKLHNRSIGEEEGVEEVPRSPHEREKEFRGVFTPSYLPLLDSTSRNERRSSADEPSPSLGIVKEREMEHSSVDASTDTRSLTATPELRRPPTPKRRNTDEASVASVASDHSDGPTRRSALRRYSSNSAKLQSPRRVRFDFAGSEVLPSASPQPEESLLAADVSSSHAFSDSSDDEGGAEQIEDIDSPPAPKRISSSQALRALSRGPLEDDGTVWTTVSAPPDGSPSVAGLRGSDDGSDDEEEDNDVQTYGSGDASESIPAVDVHRPFDMDDTRDDVDTVSDDDDAIDMPPLRRTQKSQAATILSPIDVPNIDDNKTPTSATRSHSKPAFDLEGLTHSHTITGKGDQDSRLDDDLDDVFQFDENTAHRDLPDSERDESSFDALPSPDNDKNEEKEHTEQEFGKYSSSPPLMIPIGHAPKPVKPMNGVVGSYKGKSFSMPVVSDEIQAKVASVNVNSFVGSLNGRSGMDESDVRSFRESFRGAGSFTGTPRSMSERMMMEDLMDAEQAARP